MVCEKCGKEFFEDWRKDKRTRETPCRFCCRSCSNSKTHSESTKKKISNSLTKETIIRYCPECGNIINTKRKSTSFCSIGCSSRNRWKDKEYADNIISKIREKCKTPEEKQRLKKIGRKGGFGKKGYTKYGTRYDSSLEEKCFDYLDEQNIKYTAHKDIPNSSKISDIYLDNYDIWIEIDGIDREKRKKWLKKEYKYWVNKLEIYKENNLNYFIYKSVKEFEAGINLITKQF